MRKNIYTHMHAHVHIKPEKRKTEDQKENKQTKKKGQVNGKTIYSIVTNWEIIQIINWVNYLKSVLFY